MQKRKIIDTQKSSKTPQKMRHIFNIIPIAFKGEGQFAE